mgnify:CR=1 FL=1
MSFIAAAKSALGSTSRSLQSDGALRGNSGSRVIQSIIERISNKSQPVVGRDPNYKEEAKIFRTESAARRKQAKTRFPMGFSARSLIAGLGGDPEVFDTSSGMPRATAESSINTLAENVDPNTMQMENQLTNIPPEPSSLIQPFPQQTQQSANQIFGDLFARQNAVGAPMMFKINK